MCSMKALELCSQKTKNTNQARAFPTGREDTDSMQKQNSKI